MPLSISSTIYTIIRPLLNATSIFTDSMDVAIAGTPEQLPDQLIPDGYSVTVRAKHTNNGLVYPGGSSAAALAHNIALLKQESVSYKVSNVNIIWVDSQINGEGVEISVESSL